MPTIDKVWPVKQNDPMPAIHELTWIDPEVLEPAWQLLPGGPSCENQYEDWQYMGSYYLPTDDGSRRNMVHEFRHRCHPSTGQRMYCKFIDNDHGPVRVS